MHKLGIRDLEKDVRERIQGVQMSEAGTLLGSSLASLCSPVHCGLDQVHPHAVFVGERKLKERVHHGVLEDTCIRDTSDKYVDESQMVIALHSCAQGN